MSEFRLLIVEDNEEELENFKLTLKRYDDETKRKITHTECKTLEDAFEKLNDSFDGAIIDLKLGNEGGEGNQVVKRIEELDFRIPVFILTGTPDAVDPTYAYVKVFKKGDANATYENLLNLFWDIYSTGLSRIMGGRGEIEENLGKVFRKNLLPQIDKWIAYGKENAGDPKRTERALLRYALNHLFQLLDDDENQSFPEEMYLHPPLTDKIRTGSIVKQKDDGQWFTVMNPACDLVIRDGKSFKTERILLVEIEPVSKVTEVATKKCVDVGSKEIKLRAVFSNNFTTYHHWLPETSFFKGGFLNFRKLSSYKKKDFEIKFDKPSIQISPSFVKDVVARFSSYYARQGQPDIECDGFIKHLTSTQETAG